MPDGNPDTIQRAYADSMQTVQPLIDRIIERADAQIVASQGQGALDAMLVERTAELTGETVAPKVARIFDRLRRFEPTRRKMLGFDVAGQFWRDDAPALRSDAELLAEARAEQARIDAFMGEPEGRVMQAVEAGRRAHVAAGQMICGIDSARQRSFAGNRALLGSLARELAEAAAKLSAVAAAVELAAEEAV